MIDFFALSAALGKVKTARLEFRPALPVDGWSLFEATRNKFFNRYLAWARPDDPYETVARMEAISMAHQRGDMSAMSVIERDSGRWVALFRFLLYRHDPEIVEMSLWVHGDFYHAAYGFEIGNAAVSAAFDHTDVKVLLGASFPTNRGVQGIMGGCGFTYHSTVPRTLENGRTVDLLEYRLTKEEWMALPKTAATMSTDRPRRLLRTAMGSEAAPHLVSRKISVA